MIMLIFSWRFNFRVLHVSVAQLLEGKNIFNVIDIPFCSLLEIRSLSEGCGFESHWG